MSRAHGGLRRAAVLSFVLALLAGLVAVVGRTPAGAAEPGGLRVDPTSVTPGVMTKGGTLVIGFDLVNTTGRDVAQAKVQVRIGTPLTLREQLANEDAPSSPVTDKDAVFTGGPLAAGGRLPGQVKIDVNKLRLPTTTTANHSPNAVYAFTLQAVDGTATLGSSQVLVPWLPQAPAANQAKTQIGVLWPLIDRPRRDGTTLPDEQQTPVFEDDGLAAELAEQGRLNQLVQIGDRLGAKVTWVVDPDLLDAAAAMRTGYRVAPPRAADDPATRQEQAKNTKDEDSSDTATALANPRTEEETTPGTGGPAAAAWLQKLTAATAGSSVVALPYADTDLAAIAHSSGATATDLTGQLNGAIGLGGATAQRILGQPARTDVAWPVEGAADSPVVNLAQTTGATTLVVSGASMPTKKTLNYTPSARAEVGPRLDALITDPRLDALLAQDADRPGARVRIQQQLVAELFTITMEDQTRQRSLLIAPPRHMSAALAQALQSAVETANPWSEVATLDALAQAPAGEERSLKAYPQDLRRTEPSERYLKTIPELQASLATFAAILSKPERVTVPYTPAVFGTLSTAWRTPGLDADTFRLDVSRSLRVLEQLVYIVPKSGVTLSGDKGTIPLTVVNRLTQAITIRIEVTSRQPNRLKLMQADPVVIEPGRTRAIEVEAESAANGKVLVDARLLTPDGSHAFGPGQTFYVNTTSIDGITLGIIGVIAALLLLFSVRAYLRRRRTGAEQDGGDEHHKDEGGDGSADEGGAAGHPEPQGPDNRGDMTGHRSWDRPEDHHAPA